MMFAAILAFLTPASFVLDTTEWKEPFSVEFDCTVTSIGSSETQRVHAIANYEAGGEGGQSFTVIISDFSEAYAGMKSLKTHNNLVVTFDEKVRLTFPYDQRRSLGRKTYPEVLTIYDDSDGSDDEILMAGPCNVNIMESS